MILFLCTLSILPWYIETLLTFERVALLLCTCHPVCHTLAAAVHVEDDLLTGLDDDRREAFVLTQVLGLQYDEAAEVPMASTDTTREKCATEAIGRVCLFKHLTTSIARN